MSGYVDLDEQDDAERAQINTAMKAMARRAQYDTWLATVPKVAQAMAGNRPAIAFFASSKRADMAARALRTDVRSSGLDPDTKEKKLLQYIAYRRIGRISRDL